MKKIIFLMSLLMISVLIPGISATKQGKSEGITRTRSFDEGWRFVRDNPAGAVNIGLDDSNWRKVDMPHDWGIEDLPGQNGEDIIGPFDKSAIDKMSSGYLTGGIAWYRKTFTLSEAEMSKKAFIQFDGVYNNADVWLNGEHLGSHPYGYTPFYFDITSYLKPAGEPNLIAVRVMNEGLNSRWYSGSGITRHVWLTLVDRVYIDISGGVYITTPTVTEKSADVKILTTLANSGGNNENVTILTQLVGRDGKVAGTVKTSSVLASSLTKEISQNIILKKPALWSVDRPDLYQARVSVIINKKLIDQQSVTFGVRSIKIDAQNGLTLNGKPLDLKGGCYHHDLGPLGAASIDRGEERKIEILKKTGFNAIRTSHNPPSPALLDACDRLGILVLDEIFDMWERPKKAKDYSLSFKDWWRKDVQSWIRRDRNHPSVFMWSIGNEIPEASDTSGFRIAKNLTSEVRKLDPTRPVTEAMVDFGGRTGRSRWDDMAPHMALLDVVGYNYAYSKYEADHAKYPERIMIATETNPPLAFQNWEAVEKLPYVIGYFVWTATDNLGEAGVGMPQLRDIGSDTRPTQPGPSTGPVAADPLGPPPANAPGQQVGAKPVNPPGQQPGGPAGGFFRRDSWPVFTNYQGDIDLIGNRKVPSYYQYVVWGLSKVEVFVHRPIPAGKREITSPWGFPDELKSWNWSGHEGEKLQVHVYTRSPVVKIELNGKVIGEQSVDESKTITATFQVPYEPGTLTARCYDNNGKETASQILKTTGKPASIRLVADRPVIRADRNDLAYVMTEILDTEGNVVPDADEVLVNYEVTGNGKIAGVGSASPTDMSSFRQPHKKAWQGRCLAIVRSETTPGTIRVKATAEGLQEASVEITAK
jgi:beta-galactosidase